MGITYETPEQKQELIQGIKKQIAEKHGIKDTENNALLDELAKTEFGRRETQASFTERSQRLKEVEAEKTFLHEQLQKGLNLSLAQNEELEELKMNDPDTWRRKVDELEKSKKSEFDNIISEGLSQVRSEASKNHVQSTREEILKNFSETNSDINLLDGQVLDQLPPRMINQLVDGEISEEDFRKRAQSLLVGGATFKQPPEGSKDKLGNTRGSQRPGKEAVKQSVAESYNNSEIIF